MENEKYFSEIEGYEIINIDSGERHNIVERNDIVIDEMGNLIYLIINDTKNKFNFFKGEEFYEVPWMYVKKIGARTLIIDVDISKVNKVKY